LTTIAQDQTNEVNPLKHKDHAVITVDNNCRRSNQ